MVSVFSAEDLRALGWLVRHDAQRHDFRDLERRVIDVVLSESLDRGAAVACLGGGFWPRVRIRNSVARSVCAGLVKGLVLVADVDVWRFEVLPWSVSNRWLFRELRPRSESGAFPRWVQGLLGLYERPLDAAIAEVSRESACALPPEISVSVSRESSLSAGAAGSAPVHSGDASPAVSASAAGGARFGGSWDDVVAAAEGREVFAEPPAPPPGAGARVLAHGHLDANRQGAHADLHQGDSNRRRFGANAANLHHSLEAKAFSKELVAKAAPQIGRLAEEARAELAERVRRLVERGWLEHPVWGPQWDRFLDSASFEVLEVLLEKYHRVKLKKKIDNNGGWLYAAARRNGVWV